MKLYLLFSLFSFFTYAHERCETQLSKKISTLPATFNLLSDPSVDFCKPLQIGQKRIFKVNRSDSPTTVPHMYQLERVSDKEYKVNFNIVFVDGENQKSNSTRSKAYTQVWRRLANECLETVRGKIKGPNGEKLTLEVEENEPKSKTPRIRVKLKYTGRANSRAWIKTMPCSTILHELLHVTGLVDEYHESHKGLALDPSTGKYEDVEERAEKLAYDCRKVREEHSVMHTQSETWRRVFGNWKRTSSFCVCGSNKSKCELYFADRLKKMEPYTKSPWGSTDLPDELKKMPSECPDGFEPYPKYAKTDIVTDEEKNQVGLGVSLDVPKELPDDFWLDKMVIRNFTPYTDSERESFLNERQWNVIIYPGCIAKNGAYYDEAANAYRTSIENGGEGCIDHSPNKSSTETVKNR